MAATALEKFSVLVIGESQNGKSSFCNVLAGSRQFETGDMKSSCTRSVTAFDVLIDIDYPIHCAEVLLSNTSCMVEIIDTPGLNDTLAGDERNALELITKLEDAHQKKSLFSSIFLVIKYDRLLDKTYIQLIDYYIELFGDYMRNNLIVIYTYVEQNDRFKKKLFAQTGKTIAEIVSLTHEPLQQKIGHIIPHFEIDCIPLEDEEIAIVNHIRMLILKNSIDNQKFQINLLSFPKTKFMREFDANRVSEITSYVSGINETLNNIIKEKDVVSQEIMSYNRAKTDINVNYSELETRLDDINPNTEVIQHSENIRATSDLLNKLVNGWVYFDIDRTFETKITRVSATVGNTTKINCGRRVFGRLYGLMFRDIDCVLYYYTTNKHLKRNEMRQLRANMFNLQLQLKEIDGKLSILLAQEVKHVEEISTYNTILDSLREEMKSLMKRRILFAEFVERTKNSTGFKWHISK